MIKIEHLNKYYSKGSKNELHVINDISLELPSTGLVVILGKSGSGKTTLLNCIGGLDKASGRINFDTIDFSHYKMGLMDLFRSENIGYVFQNYLLLPDETVWRNIDIALSIYGITNKEERNKRIDISLNSVGMGRYRRKDASALSGGQKQRVAIARALAKLPSIIIADEPTGNLDSENSLEVMDILRDIASSRLVLLVTHSDELATTYADRIIHYADGKIVSDSPNKPTPTHHQENKNITQSSHEVILSSLKKQETSIGAISLTSYQDESKASSLALTLITKNGQTYLFADPSKVHINDNSLKIITPNKEANKTETTSSNFDHSSFVLEKRKNISFFTMLKRSFASFFANKKKFKTRFFRTICFLIGVFTCVISIAAYYAYYRSSYSDLLKTTYTDNTVLVAPNKNDKGTITKSFSYADYAKAIASPDSGITGLMSSMSISSSSFDYSSISSSTKTISTNVGCYPLNNLTPHIVIGKLPTASYACAVSKSLLDALYPDVPTIDYSSFIGRKLHNITSNNTSNNTYYLSKDVTPFVSGITDDEKPFIYFSQDGGIQTVAGALSVISIGFTDSSAFFDHMSFVTREEAGSLTYTNLEGAMVNEKKINIYLSSSANALFTLQYLDGSSNPFNNLGTTSGDGTFAVFNSDADFTAFKTFIADNSVNNRPFAYQDLDQLNVISGRLPTANYEIILPYNEKTTYPPGFYDEKGNIQYYSIVGSYLPIKGQNLYAYTIPSTYTQYTFTSHFPLQFVSDNYSFIYAVKNSYSSGFFSSNVDKTISYLNSCGYKSMKTSEALSKVNQEANNDSGISSLAISLVCFAIILLLANALSSRSNMIRHIYSISVYRSIGASRSFIYKLFLSDSLVNATCTMEFGAVLFFLVYWGVAILNKIALVPFWVPLAILLALPLFSLIGTMIPLFFLLLKTPHEISVKYDI